MLEREARGPTGGRAGLDGTNLRAFLLAHRDQATDLDAFAAELGISRATLCRRARSELGDSLQRIHESMRLDEAAQLLRNDPRPIAAIAQACGYDDQRYFADRFRRRFNCSASTWRSMNEADLSGLAHEQETQRRRGPQRNF
jgi:AraC-like DNA-binding protein